MEQPKEGHPFTTEAPLDQKRRKRFDWWRERGGKREGESERASERASERERERETEREREREKERERERERERRDCNCVNVGGSETVENRRWRGGAWRRDGEGSWVNKKNPNQTGTLSNHSHMLCSDS